MNKEEIIKEIQRTADANGGVPLGRHRFFQETGVKESDWSGKFWAKWSDAVVDAGHLPNQMQEAFSDDLLLASYAQLVKEIGHIPTSPEVRMKARSDASFPSHNTFVRFGSKPQLLGKLLGFCRRSEDFVGLVALLEKIPQVKSASEIDLGTVKPEGGYVYLLSFGEEYKIGSSNNVERRFREIKTQMPYEGKIIHTISTGDPAGIEAYWHQYFKDKRLKGEWFRLSVTDIKYFKKRKLM
jgi:Meiotically up-regulated gene 113